MKSRYVRGDYNIICDRCGFKIKASKARMTWDKLFVCYPECWEPRQPQDFLKGRKDPQSVPIPRPEPPDDFI